MKVGKINWDELKQIIDENTTVKREEVRIKGGIGEDCSIVNYGEYECVISTDPITGADVNIGKLAVNINCNDVASCGVEPLGILVTILAPENSTIDDIKRIMRDIDEETRKLNVQIIGGHTEVTRAVNRIVVSCTVIGKCISDKAVATSGAKIGDDIVVTKKLCLEGTSIVANDYEEKLKHILTGDEIEEAKSYINHISVVKEGVISGKLGVNSMHDITEGGVLGALWEVSEASNVGFQVEENRMPISEITKKICNTFDIDPLRLISSGSMLITCSDGMKLVEELNGNGIQARIIGKVIEKGGILCRGDESINVTPPERDELFVLEEKLEDIRF